MRESGKRSVWRVACIAVLAMLGLVAACKSVELASPWVDEEVVVDGVNDEWIGATTYFEKQDVNVGLLNDDEFLYVSLVTSGPVGRLAMAAGLTVWFDPSGGKDEWYGIGFPVPPEPNDRSGGGRGGRGGRGRDARAGGRGGGRSGTGGSRPGDRLRQVELEGPGELSRRRLPLPVGGGLEVAIRRNGPTFVYELKVALARNDDYRMGLGVEPGSEIGVSFVTGEMGGQGRGRGGFGGGFGGGGGRGGGGGGRGGGGGGFGGGGGRGGGGGGRGGPGGGDRPDPLELWAKVQLSTRPSS